MHDNVIMLELHESRQKGAILTRNPLELASTITAIGPIVVTADFRSSSPLISIIHEAVVPVPFFEQ